MYPNSRSDATVNDRPVDANCRVARIIVQTRCGSGHFARKMKLQFILNQAREARHKDTG